MSASRGLSPERTHARGAAAIALLAVLLVAAAEVPRGGAQAPGAGAAVLRLNPNTATAEELTLLPGLGPVRAAAIVSYRGSVHPGPAFAAPADLEAVHGIGPITAERLTPYWGFD